MTSAIATLFRSRTIPLPGSTAKGTTLQIVGETLLKMLTVRAARRLQAMPDKTMASPVLVLATALAAAAAAGCATSEIAAPSGELPVMTVAAQGVQIHECRAAPGAAPAWSFVAPEANLFDARGVRIGRHGAGPSWEHEDGSRFDGTVRTHMAAPRAGAIPWLLITARQQGAAVGAFSRVTSVQRVNTVGGQPPDHGCDAATLGHRAHVAYRADYVLFVRRSSP